MRNHHILDASILDAVHMFRAGQIMIEDAAKACGISLGALQAHLNGVEVTPKPSARANGRLTGSPQTCGHNPKAERTRPNLIKLKAHATDHFVFYQENGRWLWERICDSNAVVRTSRHDFANYLDCVNNAKKHGWKGTPLFFAASDQFLS